MRRERTSLSRLRTSTSLGYADRLLLIRMHFQKGTAVPRKWVLGVVAVLVALSGQVRAQDVASLRAPAVPLIPVDPYFSVWCNADRLTENLPDGKPGITHWSGAPNPLTSLVNVDGKTYR